MIFPEPAALPEILNIGYDLEEVPRFGRLLRNAGHWPLLCHDVFTASEQQCNYRHQQTALCYTLCFCFKEAMMKALKQGWMMGGPQWDEMELLFEDPKSLNTYRIHLTGRAQECLHASGVCEVQCLPHGDADLASCQIILFK